MTNSIKLIRKTIWVVMMLLPFLNASASTRQKLNFNSDWLLHIGDMEKGEAVSVDDAAWYKVTLPHPWNDGEAYKVPCHDLSDTVVWYRKHFTVEEIQDKK